MRLAGMTDLLFGIAVSAVFSVFWLSSQDWFDVLPRRVRRRIGTVSVLVLLSTWAIVPSVFQEGLARFVTYAASQTQAKVQDILTDVYLSLPPTPPPSPAISSR
jgi:hypothetical protein